MSAEAAAGAPRLSVPEIPPGTTLLEAALTYAAAGWFVCPVDPLTKNPGSRLGKGWQLATSREPSVIRAWWERWPDASLALHVGRSGAVCLDVDRGDMVPILFGRIGYGTDEGWQAPFQSTRTGEPGRGHYLFAAEPGAWGNSLAGFRAAGLEGWGEVRGLNAVIVVEPSVHTKPGGRYEWLTTGELPEVPPELAALLRPPGAASGSVTPTDVLEFLAQLPGDGVLGPCPIVQAALAETVPVLESMAPGGRHDYMLSAVQRVVRLGEQGHHGAAYGLEALMSAFLGAKPEAGDSEYADAVTGAVRNALAAPTLPQDAGCCPSWLQARLMQEWGFTPPPVTQPVADGVVVVGPWQEPAPQVRTGAGKFTDAALAETLAAEALVGSYRWASGLKWLHWDGVQWRRVPDAEVLESTRLWALGHIEAATSVARMQAGETGQPYDDTEVKAWMGIAKSAGRLKAITGLAQGVPGVLTEAARFDADPDVLNVTNGIVDLRTGQLMPHDPNRLCTKLAPAAYTPGQQHRDWYAALEALPADDREWLQLRLGQAITGHMTPDDVMPICQGTGENGKGTLFDAVVAALGDYHVRLADRVLTASPDAHPTELMELRGARLATIDETPEGRQLNVVRLKKTVGSSYITARFIAQDSVTYAATHSLFVLTNYEPIVTETDHGTWRRLAMLRFPYTFRKPGDPLEGPLDRHGDPGLRIRLQADLTARSAVLSWLVDGAWAWYAAGAAQMPQHTPRVKEATQKLRADSDVVYGYWDDRIEPAAGHAVLATDLLTDFNQWLSMKGMNAWSDRVFKSRFGDHQVTSNHRVRQQKVYRWAGEPVLSRPASGYGMPLPPVPQSPILWLGMAFRDPQNRGPEGPGPDPQNRPLPAETTSATSSPDGIYETDSPLKVTGDDVAEVAAEVFDEKPPVSGPQDSVTQSEEPEPKAKPKTKSAEAKAEAKRQLISELAGPDVQLPAMVIRRPGALPDVTEISLEDAEAWLSGLSPLTVDVETSGYPLGHELYELRLVQLGDGYGGVVFDPDDVAQAVMIRTCLEGPAVLHAHNAAADIVPLAAAGLGDFDAMWERMDDTVIRAKLNDPKSTGSDPGLKAISDHLLGADSASTPSDEARGKLFDAMGCLKKPKVTDAPARNGWHSVNRRSTTFVRYAGSDVLDTSLVAQRLPELPDWLHRRERTVAHMVSRIALHGIPLDTGKLRTLHTEHTDARAATITTMQDHYGIKNPGSGPQVAQALLDMGVELPRTAPSPRHPNGQPSVAEGVLEGLKTIYNDATAEGCLINDVLTYRHHDTALKLFLTPYMVMADHGDGRARTTIYTLGADTGRMSSTRFNFQQLPRQGGFRAVMATDPGMLQIGADFSSVEIRVAAEVSGDQMLLRMLDEGLDPHAMAARIVFGEDFTKEQRYAVKRGVFGRIYGGGLATISKQMGVPEYIGQQLLDAIDTLWPVLAQWSRDITNAVKAGLLTTWTTHSGRIIHLPVDKAYAAPNYIIQGTARELLMDALMRWRETRWGTAVMWPVHDEVDAHVPAPEAHDATAELVRCMETTLPSGVRIIAEPSEPSPFWQDAA